MDLPSPIAFSILPEVRPPTLRDRKFLLKGEGWARSFFAWGKCREGLRRALIYPLHGGTFGRKRDAAGNFAESTAAIRACLGQTGPCGYPHRGRGERAQDIEEVFTKCGEDAKEHRSSFKNVQGK